MKSLIIWLSLLLWLPITHANNLWIDSVSVAGSLSGEPNNVRGGRIAVQKEWPWQFDLLWEWYISGYWDFSYAYWKNDGDPCFNVDFLGSSGVTSGNCEKHDNLHVFSISPMFRFQRKPFNNTLSPYVHASAGLAYMSRSRFGRRDLGSPWTIQDLLGAGIQFGERQQYDLSLHYLHYSNAGLAPPNAGVDIFWMAMFRYYL